MRKPRTVKIVIGLLGLAFGGVIFRAWDAARHGGTAKVETAAADWAPAAARDIVDIDLFDKARALYAAVAEALGAGSGAHSGVEILALLIAGTVVVLFLLTRLPSIHRLLWRTEHEVEKETRSHPGELMSMSMDFLRVTTILGGFTIALLVVRALMDLGKVVL